MAHTHSKQAYLHALAGRVVLGLVLGALVGVKVLVRILLAAVGLDADLAVALAPLGWIPDGRFLRALLIAAHLLLDGNLLDLVVGVGWHWRRVGGLRGSVRLPPPCVACSRIIL